MIKIVKKHKELLLYSSVNIIDKFLIFIIPLAALFLFKDKQLYNDIEYISSVSSILLIFLDLGMKNYLFYGYKISQKKHIYLRDARYYFNFLIQFYIILFSLLLLFKSFVTSEWVLLLFIIIRALYTLVIGFYAAYFRLIDKPSRIYVYSVSVSVLTILIMLGVFFMKIPMHLIIIYIVPFLGISIFIFHFYNPVSSINYNRYFSLIKTALAYSYPIIINLIMMGFINQFGRIYAYNYLDTDSMFEISIIQRISMILLLIHASIMGFYAKKIFISLKFSDHRNILLQYTLMIIFFTILVFLGVWIYNLFAIIPLNLSILTLFLVGTLLWCYTAYFELYFNRANINKYIPIITLFAFLTYLAIFSLSEKIDIYRISEMYLASNTIGFLVTLNYLKIKKVLHYDS